jgi:VCBS repeat protein/GEVED domain-containing protein
VDGDGDLDVLSASQNDRIAWYENGPSGFTVAESGGVTVVQESGTTDTFTVVLDEIPTPQVVITVTSGDTGEATVDQASLTFTEADWNIPQTVLVTGVEDAIGDGDQTTRITLSIDDASSDDVFDRLDDQHVFVITVGGGIPTDFGDAPPSYLTTLDRNGARHSALGATLGSVRDWENNGVPSADADGDDNGGTIDDEDGVAFGSIQVGQTDAVVTVNVRNTRASARLDAWIDFNGDGIWGGPGEQIMHAQAVVGGDNLLHFDVPSWTISGQTYARFRLSTLGNLAPSGYAEDGEVEDYLVTIDPPVTSSAIFGPRQILSDTWDVTPFSLQAGDFDDDGDEDLLAGWSGKLAWYENDGRGGFLAQHVIRPTWSGSYSVCSADLDGDGDLDVLSASAYANRLDWYENTDGGSYFAHHAITTAAGTPLSVFAVDLDADGDLDDDGDLDVLSASSNDDKIAWYENTGGGIFGAQEVITADADGARSVYAVDLDEDGDPDVLSISANRIGWHENAGDGSFSAHHTIATKANYSSVHPADLDGDGDQDVIAGTRYDGIVWYEKTAETAFSGPRIIDTRLEMPNSVFPADMDEDGDQDVLGAFVNMIAWCENNGGGTFGTRQIVTTDADYASSAFAADLDGDGDLDVLSASGWYENMGGERLDPNRSLVTGSSVPLTWTETATWTLSLHRPAMTTWAAGPSDPRS